MTNHTVKQSKAQYKALAAARRDAAFQRFFYKALGAEPRATERFDQKLLEGFAHA